MLANIHDACFGSIRQLTEISNPILIPSDVGAHIASSVGLAPSFVFDVSVYTHTVLSISLTLFQGATKFQPVVSSSSATPRGVTTTPTSCAPIRYRVKLIANAIMNVIMDALNTAPPAGKTNPLSNGSPYLSFFPFIFSFTFDCTLAIMPYIIPMNAIIVIIVNMIF